MSSSRERPSTTPSSAELDDPFHWDVDQVISTINPDADAQISESIRYNEVNGRVLLSLASYDTLKSDLGIIPLGKRERIMSVVNQLRRQSLAYSEYAFDLACSVPLPLPRDDELEIQPMRLPSGKRKRRESSPERYATPVPARPLVEQPVLKITSKQTSLAPPTPALSPAFGPVSPVQTSAPSPVPMPPSVTTNEPEDLNQLRRVRPLRLLARDNSSLPLIINNPWVGTESTQAAVEINSANGSVQYRQLAEVDIDGESDIGMDMDVGDFDPVALDDEPENELENVPEEPSQQSVRRIAPTVLHEVEMRTARTQDSSAATDPEPNSPVEPSADTDNQVVPKGERRKNSYFPHKASKVDAIFYDVGVGEDIEDSSDDDNFQLCGVQKPPGQRRYVEKQIRRFFQGPDTTDTVSEGHIRTAIKPYSNAEKLLQRYEHQSITVFDARADNVRVRRETTASLPLSWPGTASRSAQSGKQIIPFADAPIPVAREEDGTDFDYLRKWENTEGANEILPVFGESGSENEYDLATWQEIQESRGEIIKKPLRSTSRQPLSKEQVKEAVEEAIQSMVAKWREKVLPKKEETAYKRWKRAVEKKSRRKTARKARAKVEGLNLRIEKMGEEIGSAGMGWTAKEQVHKQCKGSMAISVTDRENEKWLIQLMEQKKALKNVERSTPAPLPDAEIDDGDEADREDDLSEEESIGSDSDDVLESADDDDGLEGFVVPDGTKDYLDGKEIEVEGEMEIEEEFARMKESEEADKDSDVEKDDSDIPTRRRRLRKLSVEGEDVDDMDIDDDPKEQLIKNEPPLTQPVRTPKKQTQVIDLTINSSPPAEPAPAPPKRRKSEKVTVINLSESDGEEKVTRKARARLVKAFKDLSEGEQYSVDQRLKDLSQGSLADDNYLADHTLFYTIKTALNHVHTTERFAALSEYASNVYRLMAKLYRCWSAPTPDPNAVLSYRERSRLKNFNRFQQYMETLPGVIREFLLEPSDDDSGVAPPQNQRSKEREKITEKRKREEQRRGGHRRSSSPEDESPYRKRLRAVVPEDEIAKERRERTERTQKNLMKRIKAQERKARDAGETVGGGKDLVNLGHYAKDKDIAIDEQIAVRLKPHQLRGIQFLWQQLVQMGDLRGALLAHTMGLGKTLQVIAFLHTLATASASEDSGVFNQIPPELRESTTLILCPPSLLENWWEEFYKWLPTKGNSVDLENIGDINYIDASIAPLSDPQWHKIIKNWGENGGVLIIGYAAFRNYTTQPQHKAVTDILLNAPNIVIADEAHNLKNPNSSVSKQANSFRTNSRIAMTGSPLSNSLIEYWSMIEWIDPGYLGPAAEFRDRYVVPIEQGIYADSSLSERRKALTMLKALKSDIKLKVDRADINVIKGDLPPKTEFIVTVPLTKLQMDMYKRFVEDPSTANVRADRQDFRVPRSGTKFFDIVHLLSLICNHPMCFTKTLDNREQTRKDILTKNKKSKQALENEATKDPDLEGLVSLLDEADGAVSLRDEAEGVISVLDEADGSQLQSDLLEGSVQPYAFTLGALESVSDRKSIGHSCKMVVLKSILEFSIEQQDQVLIFSHSIITLDFLTDQMKEWGIRFLRLDGKTKMSQRQTSTKAFNKQEADVFLVSTEAGGLGLNLPAANRVIIFDFKWSPMWEEQAVGRAYRMGQKKHVYVYRFIAGGTLEENIKNTMLFKMQLADKVVDEKNVVRAAEKKKGQYLAEPKEIQREDLSDFLGKDPALDRTIEKTGHIYGISYTETFLADPDEELTEEEQREVEEVLRNQKAQREQNKDPQRALNATLREAIRDDMKYRRNSMQSPAKVDYQRKAALTKQAEADYLQQITMQENLGADQPYSLARSVPRQNHLPASQPGPSRSSGEAQRTKALPDKLNRKAEEPPPSTAPVAPMPSRAFLNQTPLSPNEPPSSTAPTPVREPPIVPSQRTKASPSNELPSSTAPASLRRPSVNPNSALPGSNAFGLRLQGLLPKVFRGSDRRSGSREDEPAGTLHLRG